MERGANAPHYCEALRLNARALGSNDTFGTGFYSAHSTMPAWPTWWDWELELTSHLFKRMADRGFGDIDIRRMLAVASGWRRDVVPDRWIIETRH